MLSTVQEVMQTGEEYDLELEKPIQVVVAPVDASDTEETNLDGNIFLKENIQMEEPENTYQYGIAVKEALDTIADGGMVSNESLRTINRLHPMNKVEGDDCVRIDEGHMCVVVSTESESLTNNELLVKMLAGFREGTNYVTEDVRDDRMYEDAVSHLSKRVNGTELLNPEMYENIEADLRDLNSRLTNMQSPVIVEGKGVVELLDIPFSDVYSILMEYSIDSDALDRLASIVSNDLNMGDRTAKEIASYLLVLYESYVLATTDTQTISQYQGEYDERKITDLISYQERLDPQMVTINKVTNIFNKEHNVITDFRAVFLPHED